MAVISFHSLEDRIVKRFIRMSQEASIRRVITAAARRAGSNKIKKRGKAIKAGEQELAENPRSRSAVMRIAQRK